MLALVLEGDFDIDTELDMGTGNTKLSFEVQADVDIITYQLWRQYQEVVLQRFKIILQKF